MLIYLEDVVVSGELLRPDVDVDPAIGAAQEVSGQLLDLPRPGRGPHEHLSVRTNLLEDLPDLGLEAHVKHPVRLVKAKVLAVLKADLASLQEVDQTTRSGDQQMTSTLKFPHLVANIGATVHNSRSNFGPV